MLKHRPCIGNDYKRGFAGKRVLVLGESHYFANADDAHEEVTSQIVSDLFDPV